MLTGGNKERKWLKKEGDRVNLKLIWIIEDRDLVSLPPCSKWPLNPAWTGVLTQKRGIYAKLRGRERVFLCFKYGHFHLLPNKLYFPLQMISINTDWSYSIFSLPHCFLLLLQGKPPSKKAKVLNKVNKAPPPPAAAAEGTAQTQTTDGNTSNACLSFLPVGIGGSAGFDWGAYLDQETSVAAPVTCFRHVSLTVRHLTSCMHG